MIHYAFDIMKLMVKNKNLLVSYKLLFAALGLSAVVTEIVVIVGRGTFVPANFFSFFTIESNIFAAVMLIVSALALIRNKRTDSLIMFRGAATLYMAITGVIFALLLSGLDAGVLTALPWDNTVLHYLLPIAVVIDWIIDPPKKRISFKRSLVWMVYPLTYLFYTLVRGHIVGWYPYPFLNPTNHGYAPVLLTSIGVAGTVLVFAWILTRVRSLKSY